jgi:hypothetical protein
MELIERFEFEEFIEYLTNVYDSIVELEYEDEEEAVEGLSLAIDLIINLNNALKMEDLDEENLGDAAPSFLDFDDKKTQKLLKKKYPFLHTFILDVEIKHKDFDLFSDEFDSAYDLTNLVRMIAQTLNICRKDGLEQAKAFFMFSMFMNGLATSRYLQVYFQLLTEEFDPIFDNENLPELIEKFINNKDNPSTEGFLKRIK